jgi:hypothetical protein
MDRDWMRQQLDDFVTLVEKYEHSRDPAEYVGDGKLNDELHRAEPTLKQILQLLDPQLAEKINIDMMAGPALARNEAQRGIGILTSMDEWAVRLTPDAPALAADRFHPWVWDPAAPLWAADAYQDAVLAAARTVNRRVQQKIGRHGASDADLFLQTFDMKDAVPGKARLRFSGDRTSPTWRARQEGAKYFGAGVFQGIRNVAAHEDGVSWSQQEALEHLAALSVLARWVDEATVESV